MRSSGCPMKILCLQTMFFVAAFVTSLDANICRCPRESTSVLELAPEKKSEGGQHNLLPPAHPSNAACICKSENNKSTQMAQMSPTRGENIKRTVICRISPTLNWPFVRSPLFHFLLNSQFARNAAIKPAAKKKKNTSKSQTQRPIVFIRGARSVVGCHRHRGACPWLPQTSVGIM